jgi:hypothetical protein
VRLPDELVCALEQSAAVEVVWTPTDEPVSPHVLRLIFGPNEVQTSDDLGA